MHEICCGIHETCMFHVEFFQQGKAFGFSVEGWFHHFGDLGARGHSYQIARRNATLVG